MFKKHPENKLECNKMAQVSNQFDFENTWSKCISKSHRAVTRSNKSLSTFYDSLQ